MTDYQRWLAVLGTAVLLLCFFGVVALAVWSQPHQDTSNLPQIKAELESVQRQIKEAEQEDSKYSGGLIKSLIGLRLEVLRTTAALLEQKIHALEKGARFEFVVPAAEPDSARASEIEKDIDRLRAEIAEAESEASRYSGGLVHSMHLSRIATQKNTLAILQQRALFARHGIAYPTASPSETVDSRTTPHHRSAGPQAQAQDRARSIILPTLSNKRHSKLQYQDYILWDVSYEAVGLTRPARAIKGVLEFADLFGDVKFEIQVTLNDPLRPGGTTSQKGVGFEFNQFRDTHGWMLTTDLRDMRVFFRVQSILYEDGSTEHVE